MPIKSIGNFKKRGIFLRLISSLHSFLYGSVTVCLIFAFFIFINIKTRFIGIRKIGAAATAVFLNKNNSTAASPIKAALVSLCATVGTGNIVGVAGAVTLGGPGALFWMWISAFLALSVKFTEIYLSSLYKSQGSAFSYIYAAIKSPLLKKTFLISGVVAALGIGNLTQTNAAAGAVSVMLNGIIPCDNVKVFIGAVFALLCIILLKRESSAVKFCENCLPIMAIGYILLCLFTLYRTKNVLPQVFISVFRGAFCPRAVTGGAVGGILITIKSGIARGIFSNEAGLSTASLAYEKSEGEPFALSLFGIFEVFVDTVVLCTLTGLVVLASGTAAFGKDLGVNTTLNAFSAVLGQKSIFLFCPIVCFFAFSSVIGWGIYARRFAEKLSLPAFVCTVIYALMCVFGAIFRAWTVWQIAEISTVFMMAINCRAVIFHREKLSSSIH